MTKRTTCYYGLLTDCTNATRDADCKQCAERLIDGVVEMLRPAAISGEDRADRSIVSQDDAIREHATGLADVLAKRLSGVERRGTEQ